MKFLPGDKNSILVCEMTGKVAWPVKVQLTPSKIIFVDAGGASRIGLLPGLEIDMGQRALCGAAGHPGAEDSQAWLCYFFLVGTGG
jgi:hypothetical protein